MDIGRIIKKCRQLRNLTLDSLANKTGLSKSYLSLVESGKREVSMKSLQKVARVLNIPMYLLIYLAAENNEVKEMSGALKSKFDKLLLGLIKKNE
jgi:transcriptional regulator with XRE-family HTH domain